MSVVNNPAIGKDGVDMGNIAVPLRRAESTRVRRMHLPARAAQLGQTVRAADLALRLNGGGEGLLDTTHFDTVRFPAPDWATRVMAETIADGSTAYTPYRGAPDVLEALAPVLTDFLNRPVDSGEIALTPGTQAGLFTTLSALVDEGDLVLLADPEYLFVERMLEFLGARVERIRVDHTGDKPVMDIARIEELLNQKPVLFVYSHPNNPTGSVFTEETLTAVAQLSIDGGFRILADELYSRLVYPGTTYRHMSSLPGMADRTITMLGPSKTESLSGFRLGVVVGPHDVLDAVEQTLAVSSLRAPAYAQRLLTHWLVDDTDFVAERLTELAALRDMTVTALRRVPGLSVTPREGTAYLFVDVRELGASDQEVAAALQRDAGVIVSPGYQFGPSALGHFRICYARDETIWAAALERMVKVLTNLGAHA